MPPAKKRKSHYSTTSSLELLNKPQSRRHTTHNERSVYDIPESPPLVTRSVQRYRLRGHQEDYSIPQSSEPSQEQPESSPEPNREQSKPSPGLNQEQSESSSEGEQIDETPNPSDDGGHVDPTNIYLQDHKIEDQDEPQYELGVVPYGGRQDEESQTQEGQSEQDQDESEGSQHEHQDEGEGEQYLSNPQPEYLEPLQVVIHASVENGSRHNRGVTSPASSDGMPKTPQPTTRSRRMRRVIRKDPDTVGLDAEMLDDNEAEPIYEGIAKLDLDLKDWLDKTVQNTAWGKEWELFRKRAFELPKYVHGPMPTSFNDAFQFIKCLINLFSDLENLPVDLGKQIANLRAATFTEVRGILNFNEIPSAELDPEAAGDLVVYLEGYLLPHIAVLVMLSFRAYTRYGVPASTAFDDSLGLLVDCSERIDALRGYYESGLNRQRSWRLGMRAKHLKQALKRKQLRVFLPAEQQASFETPRSLPTPSSWTRSEEMWLRDAWEQYDSSDPNERYILIKKHLADQFLRHTMSALRLKARELYLDYEDLVS
ncbi:hypothetical protein N7486_007316 [Penicillium sp. IBT 16267x]|nr:hypothetical protein N7486_007316 [Penicillium sp. IBT 16267x]